ncbi:MAG: Acetamidase/Formamidase [Marmoricola sp.]|nr:Acetamidase/Formamidase [Marmoricola sp.]
MTDWSLRPSGEAVHGFFSRDIEPAITIEAGDSVRFETLDCWWSSGPYDGGAFPDRPKVAAFEQGAGHAMTGPVRVSGAAAGMTLEVGITSIVPGSWGTCIAGGKPSRINEKYGIELDGVVHTWDLDPSTMTGRNQHGHTVALRPFMGVMGMPPPEAGQHSTVPPRIFGGNLDCRELVAGSTLYLPISVDGALFSVGDGHAAQGDGEVSGTAIECPMESVELTFNVRSDLPINTPIANTPAGWISMGLGENLDDAAFAALESMFDLMQNEHGLSRLDAIALASVVVDLRVTQIVNGVVGVHAVLPHGALSH